MDGEANTCGAWAVPSFSSWFGRETAAVLRTAAVRYVVKDFGLRRPNYGWIGIGAVPRCARYTVPRPLDIDVRKVRAVIESVYVDRCNRSRQVNALQIGTSLERTIEFACPFAKSGGCKIVAENKCAVPNTTTVRDINGFQPGPFKASAVNRSQRRGQCNRTECGTMEESPISKSTNIAAQVHRC